MWYNNVINRIEDVRGQTGLGGGTRRLHQYPPSVDAYGGEIGSTDV